MEFPRADRLIDRLRNVLLDETAEDRIVRYEVERLVYATACLIEDVRTLIGMEK